MLVFCTTLVVVTGEIVVEELVVPATDVVVVVVCGEFDVPSARSLCDDSPAFVSAGISSLGNDGSLSVIEDDDDVFTELPEMVTVAAGRCEFTTTDCMLPSGVMVIVDGWRSTVALPPCTVAARLSTAIET